MKHRRNQWMAALLLVGALSALPLAGQSQMEKKAQELYSAKDYKGCLALLEKEVQKPDASQLALRIAMNANIRSGNPVTAAQQATALLKKAGTKNSEIVFEAAEIAELAGDEKLAVARYLTYIKNQMKNPNVKARLAKASAYVRQRGTYVDELILRGKLYGKDNTASAIHNAMSSYFQRGDYQSVLQLTPLVFSKEGYLDCKRVTDDCLYQISDNRNKFQPADARRMIEILTNAPLKAGLKLDYGRLHSTIADLYIKSGMSTMERYYTAMNMIKVWGYVPEHDSLFSDVLNKQFDNCKSPEAQEAFGKELMTLMPIFVAENSTTSVGAHRKFFWFIQSKTKVFPKILPPEDLGKFLTAYVKKARAHRHDMNDGGAEFNKIVSGGEGAYYSTLKDKDKIRAFCVAFGKDAPPYVVEYLAREATHIAIQKGGLLDQYLGDPKSPGYALRESLIPTALARAAAANTGRQRQFVSSLRNYMLHNNYNPETIADLIRMAKIPSDAAVTLLNSVIMQQGASAKMDAILDSLYKKGYPQNSKISDLKKKRVNGSNAAMAAAARCFSIGSDKQTEGHAACMAFAKVSKAALPQRSELAASLDEYLAFRVFEQHRRFAWNNPAQAKELVLVWGPKVTTYGKISAELLGRAWNVDSDNERVGGTYYKLLTAMMPAIIKSGDGWFERAQEVRASLGAWMPVADKDIFKGEYGVFNGDYAFDYLFSHLRNNRWTPAYTFKQWELMLNGGDSMIFYHSIHNLCNHISDKNFKHRDQIPVSFYIALLKRIVRMTEKAQYPYFYEEARVIAAVPTDKKQEVLNAYAAMTAQRSTPEKITMFNYVFAHTINQGHIPAQMRFDYIDKVLLPILKDSSVKNLRYSTLDVGVINFLSWARLSHVKETTAEQKARAVQLMKESILPVFASGNMLFPLNGDAGTIAEMLDSYLLDDVLKTGDFAKINRLAVVIATGNKADHSESRARDVMNRVNAKLLKDATEQISYVYLSIPTDGDRAHNSNLKASFNRQIAKAARDIPGIVSVDKSDAAYDIFLAQQMKREGAALQAWSYVRGKMDVLTRRWKEFDFDFVIWVVEQARKSGLYKEGMELAQTIWMEEAKLAPVEAAKLGLSKGDIYRDWKSYPAAKIEYESLTNNKRYNQTESGRLAKFRLIELLILTQDFTSARSMLERLQLAKRVDDQAEAYYLQARIDFEQMDDEAALDNLNEVFKRITTHPEARLLEGRIRLRNNDLSNLDLQIGQSVLATIAIPGKSIKLQIQDTNLSIIRGGKSLPVLVTTSKGKDSEIVQLNPDPQNPNKFSAELLTVLGKAVHNNLILELTGDDTITYCVEPNFAKENGNEDIPANHLEIRYPARMYVSSKPILSEQEQEDAALARSYDLTRGGNASRDVSRIVRPGSPFYVRVVDFDRGLDPNAPDKIEVDIACSSGDELKNYELVETGPTTGIFEAKIPTDIPFPNISVSDAVEGVDYTAVINSTKTGSWKSQPDSKRPKWLEIDTMTSCNFKTATIEMPDPNAIKSLRVIASIDKVNDEIAVYPASTEKIRGGLRVHTRNVHGAQTHLNSIRNQFNGEMSQGTLLPRPTFNRDMVKDTRGRRGWVLGKITGAFYLPEPQEINFKFMQKANQEQTIHFAIDDRILISGTMNAAGIASKRTVTLTKGVHVLTIYFCDYDKDSQIQLGMLQADGSYSPIPADWFDAEKNPKLVEYLQPKGVIEKMDNGYKLTMDDISNEDGQPLRYRKLKWVIENYNGSQLEVAKATILDSQGKVIVPVTQDLTSGKENKVLEIAAADTITVKYQDKIRIDENKATLAEKLSSSFCDGGVSFRYEEIVVNEEGESSSHFVDAARVTQGDDLIVWVSDPDEDLSEERETVKIEVSTTSGERIELELLERGNAPTTRGHFTETFTVADKTDAKRRMLKVIPGDTITARYLDKENNRPGIPFYRKAAVLCEGKTDLDLVVFDTDIVKIEDRSQAAEARKQMLKARLGSRAGDIKLFKEQIHAKAFEVENPEEVLVVNSKVPLMFLVRDPGSAKHANSTVFVDILTDTEIAAAQEEQREQMPLRVELPLAHISSVAGKKGYPTRINGSYSRYNPLSQGYFAGIVRLQLGSANDEINDLVSSGEAFNLLSQSADVRLDSDAFKVSTVIVSGSDKVYLSYKDSAGKELCKRTVQLRSDGEMELYDKTYQMPQKSVHLGQHFYVQVHDPDRDRTPGRDNVELSVKSEKTGDAIKVQLAETLDHSGIFTGSIKVDLKRKAVEGQEVKRPTANTIWSNFGDKISFAYTDEVPLHDTKPRTVSDLGEVVIGSDGELAAFTKKFKDPDMAVKTNFLMAEALFEMAKSHKSLKGSDGKPDPEKQKLAKSEIAKGKRVLEEALRDYPNTSLKAQGEFLLANLSQQLEDYRGAIAQFSTVISRYPDTEYAPKSYYQKAVCFEKMASLEKSEDLKRQIGDMACEEYVRLTYLYPNSSLATDAKLRLGNYYYLTKRYRLAASVLEKFGMAHPEHKFAGKALILAGYASIRFEEQKVEYAKLEKNTYKPDYTQAIRIFLEVDEKHKGNPVVRAEGMYFAGDCLFKIGTHESQVKAYQVFQRLIWDYPETKWAKAARGRMAANPIKNTR